MPRNIRRNFVSPPPPRLLAKAGAILTILMSCFLFATLTLTAFPAHAQNDGNWGVTDQNNNPLSTNGNGAFILAGPLTGTANLSGSYPDLYSVADQANSSVGYAFIPNPQDYQFWLFQNMTSPNTSFSGSIFSSNSYNYIGGEPIWARAVAPNGLNTNQGYFQKPVTVNGQTQYVNEAINGSASAGVGGNLWAVFNWDPNAQYYEYMHQPVPTAPSYIDVLLTTNLSASAYLYPYGNPSTTNGLAASATASDNLNESVSSSGVTSVVGKHLLRVPVDPDTDQAQVSLSGTASATASNGVSFGQFENYPGTNSGGYFQTTNGFTQCEAGAYLGGAVQLDPRDVTISCPTIETSYYKSWIILDGVDTPVAVGHQRASDGSMLGDSVATWNNVLGQYVAGPDSFVANALNFVSPTYAWSSGTPSNQESTQLQLNLGTTTPQTSPLTVTVTDSDGTVGSNTYTVTWHAYVENWTPSGSATAQTPTQYGSSGGPQLANGYVNISVPAQSVNWSLQAQAGGGLLTTGAAMIAVAAPETDPVIIGLLAAAGYKLSTVTPPPPTIYPEQGTLQQFTTDVQTQEDIKTGNTSGIFMPNAARMNQGFADAVSASGNYAGYFNGGSQGTRYFDVTAYVLQWQQIFVGDGYNVNGYTGPVSAPVNYPGSVQYVFSWT